MPTTQQLPNQHSFTLRYTDSDIENEFCTSYDESIRLPLLQGIIISILSWYSSIGLILYIIPEQASWMVPLTLLFIGSYFGFIVYVTLKRKLKGYYHLLGAISNAWAGLFTIYYCHQFPNGVHLILPVLIFIIFFGSYMVRLRWIAGSIAALTYTISYCWYLLAVSEISSGQVALYIFVIWMTFFFAIIAGRMVETNNRISFIQRKIIAEQNAIIEKEKQVLLQEVHHRVKNNLQIIVSLINLELLKEGRTYNRETLRKLQSRILSMSLVHLWMKQSSDFDSITLKKYTENLISNIKDLATHHDNFEYHINIPEDHQVDIETAIPLGIVLNEMITNFFEHCSGNENPSFSIKVEKLAGGDYKLTYHDNGKGFPDGTAKESDTTFGLELIDVLIDQLEGEFNFSNQNGAVYEITFKPSFN